MKKLALAALIACALPALAQEKTPADSSEAEAAAMLADIEAALEGKHRFRLSFEPSAIADLDDIPQRLEQDGILKILLDALAAEIHLPQDIPVTFKDCGDANAYWQPEEKSITYCYELINLYANGYKIDIDDLPLFSGGNSKEEILYGTTLFVLFHELGHGLIHLFDIPTTGREEDAVDQFATLLLTGMDEENAPLNERPSRFALMGAYFFKSLATQPGDLTREILADEHALGQQRYYDVMCLVLGSNEEIYQPIITAGIHQLEQEMGDAQDLKPEDVIAKLRETDKKNLLPYERAIGCETQYQQYHRAWERLAEQYMQQAPAAENGG